MQTNKVQIIPDDLGNVIRVSVNNPEYAHVRLQQVKTIIGSNGWVKSSVVSTLLHGKVDDLQEMGIAKLKELPGKIIIKESLEPFSTADPDRDLKMAGDTGIICCLEGQPIYRKTLYVPNLTAEDELIAHTNGDAIRAANGNSAINVMEKLTKPKVNKPIVKQEPVEDTVENVSDIVSESDLEEEELSEIPEFDL